MEKMHDVDEHKIIERVSVPDGIMQSTVDDIAELTHSVSWLYGYKLWSLAMHRPVLMHYAYSTSQPAISLTNSIYHFPLT